MHRAPALAALALSILVAGCDDSRDARPSPVAPLAAESRGRRLAVDGTGSDYARLELELSGRTLREAQRYAFEAKERGPVVGALDLPAGDYGVVARGYDAEGRLTHEGKGKLHVGEALTPQVELALAPAPGADWGVVRIGSYRLTVSQSRLTLREGEEAKVEIGVVDADGRELPIEKEALRLDIPGLPDGVPPIEVVYGGLKAWLAWQQQNGFRYGQVHICDTHYQGCIGIEVLDGSTPTAVTAGAHVACVLRSGGQATCWGENANGETGMDAAGVSHLDTHDFVQVAAGTHNHARGAHVCGVDRQGAVWCWGLNTTGQLGNGSVGTASDKQPVPQQVPLPLPATMVAPGARHTCALLTDGTVYCWGEARMAQLGNGTYRTNTQGPANALTPVPVSTAERFTTIEAGNAHTCGLTAKGQVFCWGRNVELQTGVATAQSVQCDWQALGGNWDHCVPVPTLVQGAPVFAQLAVGSYDTCGITSAGDAWCWGNSVQGNTTWTAPTPVPQQVQGGVKYAHLSIGGGFKCGFDATREGACWGANNGGQLGTGTPTYLTYVPVAASMAGHTLYAAMDAGDDFSCALRYGDGKVVCWGVDIFGTALGFAHPGTDYSATPQEVTVLY